MASAAAAAHASVRTARGTLMLCATDGLGPHLEKRRKGGGDVSTCPSIARSRSHAPSAAPPPSSHRPTQKKSFERRTFLLAAAKLAAHAFCHQLRSPAAILFPQPRHACPPPLLSAQHRSRVSARAARSAEEKHNRSAKTTGNQSGWLRSPLGDTPVVPVCYMSYPQMAARSASVSWPNKK